MRLGRSRIAGLMAVVVVASGGVATGTSRADTSSGFAQCPAVGVAPTCDVLITVAGDGQVSVAVDPNLGPYDGSDDMLVGVQNNSPRPLNTLSLSAAGTDIFNFDSDGLCTFITCSWDDPTTYEGPGTVLTPGNDYTSGSVDFPGGLAAGSSTYFSLEGTPDTASATQGTVQTTVHPAPSNDPGFTVTPPAIPPGYGLPVTVAQPPALVGPGGQVFTGGSGRTGVFDPGNPATYKWCDPGTDASFLNALKVTATCFGSGQAFMEPDIAPKNWCVVHVGFDILSLLIPAGKAADAGKLVKDLKALQHPLKDLAAALKTENGFKADAETVNAFAGLAASVTDDVLQQKWTKAAGEIIQALAGGADTITKVALKVDQRNHAFKLLVKVENVFTTVTSDLSGYSDLVDCVKKFKQ